MPFANPLDPQNRRAFLRHLFLTAGAVGASTLLAGCSDDSDDRRPAEGDVPDTEVPDTGAPAPGTPDSPAGREFALVPGPLANVGPLVDTGIDGILAPAGFAVRVVARHLSNPKTGLFDPLGLGGYNWHRAPDGGACYAAPDGGWVYVSNSEADSGGVGALRFAADGTLIDAYPILKDSRRNCAGGATPWQTWLSCEETGDGVVWECYPFGPASLAQKKPALGLFNHEAAAVDITTRTVFLTEDAGEGRLYRFVADADDFYVDALGQPRLRMEKGRLQVLNIAGYEDGGYVADQAVIRTLHRVTWTDLAQPARRQDEVRAELAAAGQAVPGTIFRGGEGIWRYDVPEALREIPPGGSAPTRAMLFFACKGDNRVYAYDIDNDLIETVFDNDSIDPPFDDVDNVVVSPAGDVIVAEDGELMRLMVVVPNQPSVTLLQITYGGSELTGPAFTMDGSRLYFSSQRGPNGGLGVIKTGSGATYELTIPPEFRTNWRVS